MKNNKDELREFYLKVRRELEPDFIAKAQQAIDAKAIKYIEENKPKTIVIYYAIKGENEVDTTNIISYCLDHDIAVYLPRWNHIGMNFYKITKLSDLISINNYYMPNKDDALTEDQTVDIAFIPVVGFDKNNNRLGYGAGYYDKWIEKNKDHIKELVGLAWDKQQVKEDIDKESHDIPLNRVIIN